jgi:TolB-like protein/DNA-binding winged helix-turn-helix (wHTH) protein
MLSDGESSFRLGSWTVEPLAGALRGPDGELGHLEPKVMDVLVLLARRPNELVTRQSLLDAVWGPNVSADQLLTRAISEIRRALDDHRGKPAYIETVPKRGYKLIADVSPIDDSKVASDSVVVHSDSKDARKTTLIAIAISLTLGLLFVGYRLIDRDVRHGLTLDNKATRLEWVSTADLTKESIAVLPFVNMSDDPDSEYFSDGLSEEIRNLLAEIPALKVIGRTSSFSFKGKNEDLRVIGNRLGANTILDGSVRKSGDRVRVTAELINAADGSRIWTGSYHRTMTDIFELQDDIAAAILDALKIHIGTYPSRGRPTEIAEAYALFLRAKAASNVQDAETAEKVLRQAVERDPKFAEALELLAHVYWTDVPGIDWAEGQRLSREFAARALTINPELEFARALLVEADPDKYSLFEVIEAQIRAANKQPGNPAILRTLSWNLGIAGYLTETLRIAERFVELDPLASIAHVRHSAVLRALGRESESTAAFQAAAHLTVGDLDWDWMLGEIELGRNRDQLAIEKFEAAVRRAGSTDAAWVRTMIDGARDPITGQAHLDQQIPAVLQSLAFQESGLSRHDLNRLYLFLGHLDRYFQIILELGPSPSTWSMVPYYVWWGTVLREQGFTAHPKYLEVAERMGFIDLWEQRGPPDFCEKVGGAWACI